MIFTVPELPPSNNQYIGRNARWAYQAEKKRWCELIGWCCRPKPDRPIEKAAVRITYFFPDRRRRDPDNYSGKMILDGLVRNGLLKDDSFECIDLSLQGLYDKQNPRTEIEIRENGT